MRLMETTMDPVPAISTGIIVLKKSTLLQMKNAREVISALLR